MNLVALCQNIKIFTNLGIGVFLEHLSKVGDTEVDTFLRDTNIGRVIWEIIKSRTRENYTLSEIIPQLIPLFKAAAACWLEDQYATGKLNRGKKTD